MKKYNSPYVHVHVVSADVMSVEPLSVGGDYVHGGKGGYSPGQGW